MPFKIMQQNSNKQIMVTIPRQLALALGYKKGDKVEWRINKAGKLELEKVA